MRPRLVASVLMLMITLIPGLPVQAQQKPFTQDQVQGMVRDGLGDETGAKAIEQRGIDFAPSEDFLQSLKATGAGEAFLTALRAAKHPESQSEKKPINQIQVFALLAGQVPNHRVAMLIRERGIDFEPTDEYLQEIRLTGGDELVSALKSAKVTKPMTINPTAQAQQAEVRRHVARGVHLLQARRIAEAEAEFRAAIRLNPGNAELHAVRGEALKQKGDLAGAITECRTAVRLNPGDAMLHSVLSSVLADKGDLDNAISEQREAVRLDPNNDKAHYNLAVLFQRNGELREKARNITIFPSPAVSKLGGWRVKC